MGLHDGETVWDLVSLIETIEPGKAVIYCNECRNLETIPAHYNVANFFLDEYFWICNICGSWRDHPKSKVSNQGRAIYA